MKNINIKTIRIDGGTQSRVELNEAALADYTDAVRDGSTLPPVVVFFDGADHWLADGFHRYHAYGAAGKASIPADVRSGTKRDAMLFSFGANGAHGLRRTNDDKRKAVSAMLADTEWSALSDRQIAIHCAVTQPFVSSLRKPKVITVITPEADASGRKGAPRVESYSTQTGEHESIQNKKPAAQPPIGAPAEPDDYGPDADELAANAIDEQADREAVALLLASDDKLADAFAEIKRLKALVGGLELRIAGLQNSSNEHIRTIKSLRRKLEKLEQPA